MIRVPLPDRLHVTPRLWKAAYLFHAEGSVSAQAFVRVRVRLMLRGEIRSVVRGLRSMSNLHALGGKKREQPRNICVYFENNYSRLRYDEYLAAGYTIAIGVIEAAYRHLLKDRMERAIMRWVLHGVQAMLHLRSVHVTRQWDHYTTYRIQTATQQLHSHERLTDAIQRPTAACIARGRPVTPVSKRQAETFGLEIHLSTSCLRCAI